MLDFIIANYQYLIIPFVAAGVGWLTNWIAIQMTFHPIEPIGRPPYLGWQGIIPAKAEKMGIITTRSILAKLGSMAETYDALGPELISEQVVAHFDPLVEGFVDDVMLANEPFLWEVTPSQVRTVVYDMVHRKLPKTVDNISADLREAVEDVIDLEWLVIREIRRDKTLINRIFKEVGQKEFDFIINSGLFIGWFFGLFQAGFWFFVQRQFGGVDPVTGAQQIAAPWLLPVFGIFVGYATNALAIRVIFSPVRPIRLGPFVLQGLFLRRQAEVSRVWCDLVAREILNVRNIANAMLFGPKAHRTMSIVRHHVRETADEVIGPLKRVAQVAIGVKDYSRLKDDSAQRSIDLGVAAFDDFQFNADRAGRVRDMLLEKMVALTPEEFQLLLRPAFQEDEIKLILLGAFLGGLAGLIQILTLY